MKDRKRLQELENRVKARKLDALYESIFGDVPRIPVGLILCVRKDEAVVRYALEGLPNKVMAAEYRTALPDEKTLAAEIRRTQEILRKREALALPPWEEIRAKKTAERKRGTKGMGGKQK